MTGAEPVSASSNFGGNSSTASGDLEAVKQEILTEMRREMNKMKNDIIEGKQSEMDIFGSNSHFYS